MVFSDRHKLRPTPAGLLYESVPGTTRVALFHIFLEFFDSDEFDKPYLCLYRGICKILKQSWDWGVQHDFVAQRNIENLIKNCQWWQFFDISEIFFLFLDADSGSSLEKAQRKAQYERRVNELFRGEMLGYEMKEGSVEKIGSGFTDANISETRYLLKEAEFKSADQLFEKAIKDLNLRPEPDVEDCIKNAVASIEAVGKIVVGDDTASLDAILSAAVKKGAIPRPLDQTITKLHAYRGNEPGIAHGSIRPSKVTADEAEFVLAMSAAMITYLVKKRAFLKKS